MSGHSKWHKIRRKKSVSDVKKSKIFSKLSQLITIAAREKGGNLSLNPKLRMVVEKAKRMNLSQDSIERAIKKGSGDGTENKLEEIVLEIFGPGGVPMMVAATTDNKNRTISEIKNILNKNGAKLANEGSVRWMFDYVGSLEFSKNLNCELVEETAIEAGAKDIKKEDETIFVFTEPQDMYAVKSFFEQKNLIPDSAEFIFVQKSAAQRNFSEEERVEALVEALNDNEDVQDVFVG